MRSSRRTLSIVTVALILSLLGGGIYWRLRPAAAGPGHPTSGLVSREVSGGLAIDIPQPVAGAKVVRDTLWLSVNAAGRAEAVSRVTLQAQVAGVVEGVSVRERIMGSSPDSASSRSTPPSTRSRRAICAGRAQTTSR